jgi:hypothetical protein
VDFDVAELAHVEKAADPHFAGFKRGVDRV